MSSKESETVFLGPPREEEATEDTRAADRAATEPDPDAAPEPDEQKTVGRYVLAGKIGLGGMGVVYRAYDPELDRHVALKRLRLRGSGSAGGDGGNARERLLREAQSLAQLSHPNVINVHDVGMDGDDAFITMELVEGQTLAKWLRTADRKVADIRDVFAQAGTGLMAAHEVGLIHRDFKPDNVILGRDGRVRVLDFGLARFAYGDTTSTPVERRERDRDRDSGASSTETSGEQLLHTTLTEAGSVMGTPAYMAPEQHRGDTIDARVDVYAFAVSLYRALFKKHPFTESPIELRDAVLSRPPAEPPRLAGVSKPLRRLMLRAMARDPDARPALGDLIAELRRDPHRVAKRVGLGGIGAVLTAVVVLGVVGRGDTRCQGLERRLAGVWDDAARGRVRDALLATNRPYAGQTFARVETLLDAYTDRWVQTSAGACEATHVHGSQSERALDLRSRCLDGRLAKVSALVGALSRPGSDATVENAVQAAMDLPPLDRCDDVAALEAKQPPPEDPAVRARVDDLQRRLDEAEAFLATGDFVGGIEAARGLAEEARQIDYLPIQLQALNLLATMYTDGGEAKATEALLEELIAKAARAKEDEQHAEAWIALIRNVGLDQAEPERALELRRSAEAAIARAGDSEYLHAVLRHSLGMVLRQVKREEEAYAHNVFVLEVFERTLGPDTPSVAAALNNLGGSLRALGRQEEALAHYQRALAVWEAAVGPDHPEVSIALTNIGMIYAEEGRWAEAEPLLLRALHIKEGSYGPDHPTLGATLNSLGIVANGRGDIDAALAYQRRALAISERELGAKHPRLGIAKFNAGSLLVEKARFADARPLLESARAIFGEAFGADHAYVGYVDVALARCDVGESQPQAALDRLAPVMRRLAADPETDPVDLAEARFAEAQARHALGQRAAAQKLGKQALAAFVAAGEPATAQRTAVEAWLAGHP